MQRGSLKLAKSGRSLSRDSDVSAADGQITQCLTHRVDGTASRTNAYGDFEKLL
jgi:hypothetical protein